MQVLRRSFLGFIVVLFSVQVLAAFFWVDNCHVDTEQAQAVVVHGHELGRGDHPHGASDHLADQSQKAHSDEPCNSFGFCLSGHCHIGHCNFVTSAAPTVLGFQIISTLGLPTENILVSLLSLDPPWQPPRA